MGEAALKTELVSREEFYELQEASEQRLEYFAGEVRAMAGGSPRHGRIIGEITRAIGSRLVERRCYAVPNDQLLRAEQDDMEAYPDVVVYCDEARFDPENPRVLVEPRVLFEVLSPSTSLTDRTTKLDAYLRIPTLSDYLIVWQDMVRVDQHTRQESGDWLLRRHLQRDGVIRLESLGIEVPVDEIYRFLDLSEGALPFGSQSAE